MSLTPGEYPSVQRINRAYVQVPPSPLTVYRRVTGSALHVVLNNNEQKENTLLNSSHPMSHSDASSTSLKRKFLDHDPSSLVLEGIILPPKKSKLSSVPHDASLHVKQITVTEPAKNISDEFPNGFVYCHQCNKKRDLNDTITCNSSSTTTNAGTSKQRPCKYKYCRQCLKNRYNEDINAHRLQSAIPGFKCPRCRDVCNCPRCRKAKGLEPVGVIGRPLVKHIPTDTQPELKLKAKKKAKVIEFEAPKLQKPRELPILKWRPVAINLNQDETDERIFVREFIFRFGDVLDPPIAKTHLEDLEFIGGRSRKYDDEDDVAVGWASESCLKALLLGLLGLLAKDREDNVGKMLKATAKELRSGGANLNKIWFALHALRAQIPTNSGSPGEKSLTFPDPLPPSATATTRSLRSVRVSTDTINVFHTSQMIPVVISLIDTALETNIVREEFDQGSKDNKDCGRDAKEAMRIENERWEKEKKINEGRAKNKVQKAERRAQRFAHKTQMTNVENALKIIGSSFAPRFTTLGTDDDGRVYYALSPGIAEREAAFEYVEAAARENTVKLKKKGRLLSVDERKEMKNWSWFIAVWGIRPPPLSNVEKTDIDEAEDSEGDDEDDEGVPRWWGFWDVEEIMKLAEWISIRYDLEESLAGDSPSTSSVGSTSSASNRRQPRMEQLKRLVGHLKEYAALLQWRASDDKCMLVERA